MLSPQTTPEDRLTPKLKTHLRTAGKLKANGLWDADAYRAPARHHVRVPHQCAGHAAERLRAVRRLRDGLQRRREAFPGHELPAAGVERRRPALHAGRRLDDQKTGGLYQVDYALRPDAAHPNREEKGSVTAAMVIVAAGTMGSNAILLRSREAGGIAVSPWLGKGFSGNGNYLGFVDYQYTDPAVETNSAGVGIAGGAPTSRWARTSRASSTSAAGAVPSTVGW